MRAALDTSGQDGWDERAGQTTVQCSARTEPVRTESASGEIKRVAGQNYRDAVTQPWMSLDKTGLLCLSLLTPRLVHESVVRGSGAAR